MPSHIQPLPRPEVPRGVYYIWGSKTGTDSEWFVFHFVCVCVLFLVLAVLCGKNRIGGKEMRNEYLGHHQLFRKVISNSEGGIWYPVFISFFLSSLFSTVLRFPLPSSSSVLFVACSGEPFLYNSNKPAGVLAPVFQFRLRPSIITTTVMMLSML